MRNGDNPAKSTGVLAGFGYHRVVIPVHIPNLDGYFAESRAVLRRCLDSLRLTAEGQVAVTLVADGSCPEVTDDLHARQEEGWVDQVIVNRPNRGKVDSVVGVARGSYEELVTVADCDVLFRPGWVDAIESLFAAFPECGFASVFPNPLLAFHHSSATVLSSVLRRELNVASVVDERDLDQFAESIGYRDLFPPANRKVQLMIQRDGVTACVGAPHFVFTLRRAVIGAIPPEPSRRALGDSEVRWIDEPADRLGYWRLSTSRAFAHHMGNTVESWMDDEMVAVEAGTPESAHTRPFPAAGRVRLVGRLPLRARRAFVARFLRGRLERRIRRAAGDR